jgi:uncharacterized cupin superfamily protein
VSSANGPTPFDADLASGAGPLWGLACEDLNATLLVWPAGEGVPEHVNSERDVLIVVLDGDGTACVDGSEQLLKRHNVLLIAKGARRRLAAGRSGIRYLSIHLRRPPLEIASAVPPS